MYYFLYKRRRCAYRMSLRIRPSPFSGDYVTSLSDFCSTSVRRGWAGRCQIVTGSLLVSVASFLTRRRQMSVVMCVSGGPQMAVHVPARRHPRRSDNAVLRDETRASSCSVVLSADQCDPIWRRDTLPTLASIRDAPAPTPPSGRPAAASSIY